LPDGIELRTGDVSANLLIIDMAHMVSVDSSNGKAALFASLDAFGTLQARNFEEAWAKAQAHSINSKSAQLRPCAPRS
jgi:hypothetical protein